MNPLSQLYKLGKQKLLCSSLEITYTVKKVSLCCTTMNGVTVLLLCCVARVTAQLQWQLLAADDESKFVT